MCKIVPKASNEPGPPLGRSASLFQPLKPLSRVVHQIRQTAVEGQGAHVCAELSKKLFILPCKDLGLLPKINSGEDVGSNGDVGRCHVLDAGRDPAAPHTASTRLGAHGADRRHWRERGWCACASCNAWRRCLGNFGRTLEVIIKSTRILYCSLLFTTKHRHVQNGLTTHAQNSKYFLLCWCCGV